MKTVLLIMGLSLGMNLHAAELECIGEIDPGARYTMLARVNQDLKIEGPIDVHYQDNDGFSFDRAMTPDETKIDLQKQIFVHGHFDGGSMELSAAYDVESQLYRGAFASEGSLGEGVNVDVICSIENE